MVERPDTQDLAGLLEFSPPNFDQCLGRRQSRIRYLADLAAGSLPDALDASGRAVSRLAATGTLPALRSEEVYLTRYKVLRAAGAADEAASWLDRARQTLLAKAATLPTRKLRDQFLGGTPVSRDIVAAA